VKFSTGKLADVVFAGTCLVLLLFGTMRYVQGPPEAQAREGLITTDSPGLGTEAGTPGTTVVVALQPGCRFCELSMPLYKELVSTSGAGRFGVVFQSPVDPAQFAAYLTSHGLVNVQTARRALPAGSLGTPTLVVVGSDGKVLQSWVGALSERQKRKLRQMLKI
jgi:hypothetical protein